MNRSLPLSTLGRCALVAVCVTMLVGCRSTSKKPLDRQLRRYAEAGHVAFAEGSDAVAIARYRQATQRAWARDDAEEIGRQTYNLAACLAGIGRSVEARDWLCESRAAVTRSEGDLAEVWLLDATIARQMGLLDEAAALSRRAEYELEQQLAHCHKRKKNRECEQCAAYETIDGVIVDNTEDPLWRRITNRLGDPNKKRKHEKAQERNHNRSTEAQVYLLRAHLACDQGNVGAARDQLSDAEITLHHVRAPATRGEVERVSGRIYLIEGRAALAAESFDAEAAWMFRAANYREIPHALYDAGECYEMAGALERTADRYLRTAALLYGREEWADALIMIDLALPLIEASGDPELGARLRVLFNEIVQAIEEASRRKSRGKDSKEKEAAAAEAVPPGTPPTDDPAHLAPGDEVTTEGELPEADLPAIEEPGSSVPVPPKGRSVPPSVGPTTSAPPAVGPPPTVRPVPQLDDLPPEPPPGVQNPWWRQQGRPQPAGAAPKTEGPRLPQLDAVRRLRARVTAAPRGQLGNRPSTMHARLAEAQARRRAEPR